VNVLTFFTAAEPEPPDVAGRTAVVIDVIRATSTIVEALANGAKAIYPTISTEDAIRLTTSLGRDDTLLCGERKGLKVEGFDLGNSPHEFARERIEGKRLVMTTTNGTRAFAAAQGAEEVLAASFLNLDAVARRLARLERDLVLICAGKEDRFSLDDALCAGILLRGLSEEVGGAGIELDDASRAALALAGSFELDAELLERTAAGAALVEVGLGEDLPLCAQRGRHDIVPVMDERMIHLPSGTAG
jgi:2-phosphosulfolactate phosphatase